MMKLVLPERLKNLSGSTASRSRRVWRRAALIALLLLLLLLVAGGGYLLLRPRVQPLTLPLVPTHLSATDLGLTNWQGYQQPLPANPLANPALPSSPETKADLAPLEDAAGQALIQQGELNRGLAYLQAAVLSVPDNLRYANDYRLALRNHGQYSNEEVFFKQQVQALKTPNAHVNLALAYVDEMRSCPHPPDGLVCQAQLSNRSIDELNIVLSVQQYNIIARYARGLNHLYWPTLMGHLPRAQGDLQYAVALTKPLSSLGIGRAFIPQAYTALGDVFAKDSQTDAARNVWLNGLQVAPNAPILQSRLAIPQNQLVDDESGPLRGLGVPVDTDIALFWQNGR
jgi:tetratricopeptide (TPR) repeat protein